MAKILSLLCCAAFGLYGAVIRGTVVENRSGKPLSRTLVTLQPLPGTPGAAATAPSDRWGGFHFTGLAAGSYLVLARRTGFVPVESGQRQWNAAGQPIVLEAEGSAFVTLRMPRWGGISGTVRDENGIGRQDLEVLAYRDAQPPQLAASAKSDDRGVFRIGGLTPGRYLVRTAPREEDGETYLPTFSPEASHLDGARIFHVLLDEDATGADVRPLPGRLFRISGLVILEPPGRPVTVTLSSEMGRQKVESAAFSFRGLAPGQYELVAEAKAMDDPKANYQAVFTQLSVVDKNVEPLTLPARDIRGTRIDVTPAPVGPAPLEVTAVRTDLAGDGEPSRLPASTGGYSALAPGRWKILLAPPPGQFVADFSANTAGRIPKPRADGWNEILLRDFAWLRYTLEGAPAAIHGTVRSSGEPVAGAPVFIEGYDPESRKRIGPLRTVRSDKLGAYRVDGLAPGAYRLLATFEFRAPDTAEMEQLGATTVQVDRRADAQIDLNLTGLR